MKRPKETSKKRPPTAKRAKLSAAGIQQESPRSYKLKRPIETSKKKQPATKQFKPPMAEKMLSVDRSPLLRRSPLVRNPELRLVVSPVVIAQSPRSSPPSPPLPVERSSSPSPLPGFSSAQRKLRRLKSEIWSDMDPIYHDRKLVQARCKHCNEIFSAARNSGNSHIPLPFREAFYELGRQDSNYIYSLSLEEWQRAKV
ncbi:hypothetical protein PVAP13_6KG120470, partial [Panicum virgatum]